MEHSPGNPAQPTYPEHDYVMEDLRAGKCHAARFRGQIHLYIPKEKADKIGRDAILKLAENVYSTEVLEQFSWRHSEYQHSFSIDLPPAKQEGDKRVEKLIEAIEAYKK